MVHKRFFEYIFNYCCGQSGQRTIDFLVSNNLQFIFRDELGGFFSGDDKLFLERMYKANYIGERIRQKTMSKIKDLMMQENIQPLFFKGTVIAYQLYDNPFLRVTGDIDFYVPFENIDSAYSLLCESGYKLSYEKSYTNKHHISLTNGQTYVELHKNIISPSYMSESNFLSANASYIKANGDVFLTMNPTNTLLHLLLHQYMDMRVFFPVKDINICHSQIPITPRHYYRMFEIALYWEKFSKEIDFSYLSFHLGRIEFNDYMKLLVLNIGSIFPELPNVEDVCNVFIR